MKIIYFTLLVLTVIILGGCQPRVEANFNIDVDSEVKTPEVTTKIEPLQPIATTSQEKVEKVEVVLPPTLVKEIEPEKDPAETELEPPSLTVIPKKIDYDMAFVSQAPYAVWDELHEEACEEASMIMVDKYFSKESLTAHTMEQGILNLIDWEVVNGYQVDLTAQETADILNNYFKLSAVAVTDVTVDRIKQELVAGKLVIVPAAGRELSNPYFQTPGPIYHMLVIKGFDDGTQEFITNDPGTKRGKNFRYKYQKLINAIHNWNHELAKEGMTDEEIAQGRKVMILVNN